MFGRLRCHFCGQRSVFEKGIPQFHCANCEALNFFDEKGNVIEAPQSVTAPAQPAPAESKPFHTFTRPLYADEPRHEDEVFCDKCRKNQSIYMESLSNYLPDENHPQYQQYEDRLPQFKADLEKKYPQVCTNCASRVQMKIHKADYYSKTQHTGGMLRATARHRERGTSPDYKRDDWGKRMMRILLGLLGMMVYASLLVQVAWHAYGMLATIFAPVDPEQIEMTYLAIDPSYKECAQQSRTLHFDLSCYDLFGSLIPKAILARLCILWYNHGLKDWYHHTLRIEEVAGQEQHFYIQTLLLAVRTIAWLKLSSLNLATDFTKQQLLAAHGFMIFFMFLCQRLSERLIVCHRWTMKGKIMPKPEHVDVFGPKAGPATEEYTRMASSVAPQVRLFSRDDKPFPIENLAPQRARGYSKLDFTHDHLPTPPETNSPDSDDAMDIDWQGSNKQPLLRSKYNHGTTQPMGWGAMRNELFDIQDKGRAQDERKRAEAEERAKLHYQPPVDQSPFRGRLPPAPMSMERRLRNPPTQVQFKATPLSKQQDFMKQMRDGIENGRGFNRPKSAEKKTQSQHHNLYAEDDDYEFSPNKNRTRGSHGDGEGLSSALSRTKGNLDLRQSNWRLPGDFKTETGLEDLFGGTGFSIADEASVKIAPPRPVERRSVSGWLIAAGVVALLAVGVVMRAVRQPVAVWIIDKLEGMGYQVRDT